MTIENNKITFIAEADYDNLFIPATVRHLLPQNFGITNEHGMLCRNHALFRKFCSENNMEYGG